MRLFTVHLPALAGSGKALEGAEFVRDGFHVSAFLLSVFWCLWRGLWIPALAILVACAALYGIGRALHVSPGTQFLVQLVLALLVGLEAANLRRFGLRRRGYLDGGIVAAHDRIEAEEIYFHRAVPPLPKEASAPPPASPGPMAGRRQGTDEVVGLFPEYRGR
ncbi:Protein of unknown function [Rhizobiales bacterium GAS191]|jgi:hypothetical protein|nr:Protein of unknown function [Rhizobiales bacterium GAS113]SEC14978.1 Protein of unknown function [Rhizobiales bacterium GAS191]SED05940.1 Protein of unknown function [Rhizobiales bacterium GAS188]